MRARLALLGTIVCMSIATSLALFSLQDADAGRHPLPPVKATAQHVSVPDGGATVMLLGLGLGILGAVRRWLIA